ncbi:MAG: hypothetical protein ACHQ50_09945, partial [Fimbriimonadales bacterium]
WEMPADRESDDDALTATAYMIRAANSLSSSDPGVRDDLEAALKLAPKNASCELLFGHYLYLKRLYKESIPHLQAAQKRGSKRTATRAKDMLANAVRLAASQAAKGGGE